MTYERPTTFTPSKRITAYHDDWKFSHIIDEGQELKIVDCIEDERGWCFVVLDNGKEYLLDGRDINAMQGGGEYQ